MGSAYLDWNKLFVPSAEAVWSNEIPELRKAAILVHILGLEFERIKQVSESHLNRYRQKLLSKPEATVKSTYVPPRLDNRTEILKKPACAKETKVAKSSEEFFIKETPKNVSSKSITKNSYISPDLFGGDTSKTDLDESIILKEVDGISPIVPKNNGSPKINRKGYRKFNRQKAFNLGTLKINELKQSSQPKIARTKIDDTILEDVIEGTPEPTRKRLPLTFNNTREPIKKSKSSNTLTQMFPQSLFKSEIVEKEELNNASDDPDFDLTVKDSLTLDEIADLIDSNKNAKFADIEFEPECANCIKWGSKCSKHRVPLTENANQTFAGFWDLTHHTSNIEGSPKFL